VCVHTGDASIVGGDIQDIAFVATGADPFELVHQGMRAVQRQMKTFRLRVDKPLPPVCCGVLQCVAGCLQCVAVCCDVLQCVAVCCRVLQFVAVCFSVLQRVAVCCSVSWSDLSRRC